MTQTEEDIAALREAIIHNNELGEILVYRMKVLRERKLKEDRELIQKLAKERVEKHPAFSKQKGEER